MKLINVVRSVLNPFKIDLKIYPREDLRRRVALVKHYQINKILDVGANSGQYAKEMFESGFKGKMMSFEPVPSTFELLKKNANTNRNWKVFNYGFGDKDETLEINISQNTYSSSLLKIMPNHVKSAPDSKVIRTEKVIVRKLDSVFNEFYNKNDIILLKIDVQGFEKNVLDGAVNCFHRIEGLQLEMSIEQMYQNEMLFTSMLNYIESLGFKLHSLENGFYDTTSGKLLQVDGVFFRKKVI